MLGTALQMLRGRGTAAAVSQLKQLLRAAVHATAMGRRSTQPRATQQAGKKKTQKDPTYKKVNLGNRRLAPYPDQEGTALRLGSKGSAAEVLSADNLVKQASERNTDMLRRPGLAVAMAAAAAHHGGKAVVQGIATRALDNLATMLKSPEGQAFLQAAEALKDAKSKGASRAVVRKAVRSHVKYFQSAGTQLHLGDGLSLKRVATSKSSPYIRVIWPLRVIWGYRGHLKTTKVYHRTTTQDAQSKKIHTMLCKAKSPNMVVQLRSCTCTNFTQ